MPFHFFGRLSHTFNVGKKCPALLNSQVHISKIIALIILIKHDAILKHSTRFLHTLRIETQLNSKQQTT